MYVDFVLVADGSFKLTSEFSKFNEIGLEMAVGKGERGQFFESLNLKRNRSTSEFSEEFIPTVFSGDTINQEVADVDGDVRSDCMESKCVVRWVIDGPKISSLEKVLHLEMPLKEIVMPSEFGFNDKGF